MYQTGVRFAEYSTFFGKWKANSQYGYALSWHDTEQEAITAVQTYYADKSHLLNQVEA